MTKYKNIILIAFMLAIFTITTTRAAITCITYDEAYTYTAYVQRATALKDYLLAKFKLKVQTPAADNIKNQSQDQLKLQAFPGFMNFSFHDKVKAALSLLIANNHILNTLCITLVEFLFNTHYDEFAIRLPVLIFFAIYLFAVYKCYKNNLISFTCAFLLCGNYYLCDYYGLARGYGMAHTLLFLVCIAYIYWQNSNFNENKYLIALMTLLLLAASANTISLLIFPAFGALTLFRLYQQDNLKKFILSHKIFVSSFFIIAFMLVAYHLLISESGKPLFTGTWLEGRDNFYSAVVLSFANMLVDNITVANILAALISALALIAFVISIIKNKIKNCDFVLMLIIFILTNVLMEFITHKGYMTDRVVLPFYCFIIFALRELFRDFKIKYLNIALCALCLISFASQIDLHATRDINIKDNYQCRDKILKFYMTGQDYIHNAEAIENFYKLKYAEIIK